MKPARIVLAVVLVAGTLFAGRQLLADAEGTPTAAGADPRETLATHPLEGRAFAALAKAETDPAKKLELHRIAARRAPRDLEVRAWLMEHHLAAGEPAKAMAHLDVILRLAPVELRKQLIPAVLQLATDTSFTNALVDAVAEDPPWRRPLIAAMVAEVATPGSARIFDELLQHGLLRNDEQDRWLHALIEAGGWGQAYALWASGLQLAAGEPLPMLWNGGFELDPQGRGFGWRIRRSPGSYTEFEPLPGAKGRAARIVFLGRQVGMANLEQPLKLPPGQYRLTMRVKAQALRSDQGLRWMLACASGRARSDGAPLNGSFDWREYSLEFNAPLTGCPGQWLRLLNPAPLGAARIVSGELWVDDVAIEWLDNPE